MNDCYQKQKGNNFGRKHPNEKANVSYNEMANVVSMDIDPNLNTNCNTNDVVDESNDSDVSYYFWVADSATTSHIACQRNIFTTFMLVDKKIKGIGTEPVPVKGRGTVILTSYYYNNKRKIKLHNVAYVPSAAMNLLSISRFEAGSGIVIMRDM